MSPPHFTLDPSGRWRHFAGSQGAAGYLVSLSGHETSLLPPHSETHRVALLCSGIAYSHIIQHFRITAGLVLKSIAFFKNLVRYPVNTVVEEFFLNICVLHCLSQILTSSCGSIIYSLKCDCKKCAAAPDLLFVYLVCMCAHCSRAWRCFWTRGASQSPWTTSYLLPLSLTSIKSSRSAGKTTFFFFLHRAICVCVTCSIQMCGGS